MKMSAVRTASTSPSLSRGRKDEVSVPLVVTAAKGDEKAGPLLAVRLEKPERTLARVIDEGVFGQFVAGSLSGGVVNFQDVRTPRCGQGIRMCGDTLPEETSCENGKHIVIVKASGGKNPRNTASYSHYGCRESKRSPAIMPVCFARPVTEWRRSGETCPEKKRESRLAPRLSLEDTGGDPLFFVRYGKSTKFVERVSRAWYA
jgi:hypothetical protein